jgi:hypothetical protein
MANTRYNRLGASRVAADDENGEFGDGTQSPSAELRIKWTDKEDE